MSPVAFTAPLPAAIFLTSFDPGGTERQMIELLRRLDPCQWAVHVACFQARGGWFDRAAEAAASVVEFPVTSFRSADTFRHMRAFARWCRQQRILVVHAAELYSNIFALPAAAMANVPVRIGNRREINPDKSSGQIALQRAAYSCAHKVVANSQAAAERLRSEHVPARKIAVVPNGLDMSRFVPRTPRAALRKVIIVANLRPEKGHDVLIDAAVELHHRFPDATFECVGGGPELRSLRARTEERGVARAFTFHGHCEDVPACLANADIFVLPSRSEAFPNAVLEAMASGLPIVASATGGIVEVVEDGRTGLLVPPGKPDLLADALGHLMNDASLGARLGSAARARVESSYSFERMVSGFESVYLNELMRRGVIPARQPQLATF
jgi:glycosyltransferase involved in cell wall biosynthesis